MTHEKIIEKLSDSAELREGCNRLIGTIYRDIMQDYISMCFVCEMQPEEILMLMLDHSDIPEKVIREEIRKFIEEDYKDQGVKMDGIRYNSVKDARKATGLHINTIRRRIKQGKAQYI